jgi:hypothetical protein
MNKIILTFLLVLLYNFNLIAQNTPITTLPFELKDDNRIYIKCSINQTDSLTFVFDMGADVTVINKNILGKKIDLILDSEEDNLGANGTSKVKVSTNNKLTFGSIEIDSINLLAIPYSEDSFDGVFGSNTMKDYIIEIDYDKKDIHFYSPKNYIYNTKYHSRYKLKNIEGVFTTKASVIIKKKKYTGYFEFDTGGDDGLIISSSFEKKHNFEKELKTVAITTMVGSNGIESKSPIVVFPEIKLGKKYFYRSPALISVAESGILANNDLAGIFGNGFLKRFNMILDIQHKQLFLKPNDLINTPYHDFLVD